MLKFIYFEKATKFCEIFTLLLSYVVPFKSKVKVSQNGVAFSEYMNFTYSYITYTFSTGVESEVPEFAQLCGSILGPKWEYVCAGFSLAAVFGVCIVYWILMSNFLENTLEFGQGNIHSF